MNNYFKSLAVFASISFLAGCGAGGNDPGLEYAPNMYHSVPYEPLTQITEEDAGEAAQLLSNTSDGHGEYYNSNPLNPKKMNMRVPPANTVPRSKGAYLPYRIPKDSLELAARIVKSPYDSVQVKAILKDGEELYDKFCEHCHGSKGQADGLVAEKYPGVANLTGLAYQNITPGHIYHVITHGKGLMGAHGSQIGPEDRWKISHYVKKLQNQ